MKIQSIKDSGDMNKNGQHGEADVISWLFSPSGLLEDAQNGLLACDTFRTSERHANRAGGVPEACAHFRGPRGVLRPVSEVIAPSQRPSKRKKMGERPGVA